MTRRLVLGFSTMYFFLLSIFITYITYNEYVDMQVLLSNHLMSTKTTTLALTEGNIPKVEDLETYIDVNPEVSFFSLLYETSELTVYGFLGDEFFQNTAFLSRVQNDSEQKGNATNKKTTAIVGKNIGVSKNCSTDEIGNLHFGFNNNNYIVKNVIESPMNNINDNVAFVKLQSNDILITNKIFVDGSKSENIDIAVEFMHEKYKAKVIIENDNFIKRYIFSFPNEDMLNILMITFTVIVLLSLIAFTLRYYSDEIKIKNLVGIPVNRIILSIGGNILAITTVATFAFSIIYTYIYSAILKSCYLNFHLVTIPVFALIFIVVLTFISYLYMHVLIRK